MVKMDPAAVGTGNNALGTQDNTVSAAIQSKQGCLYFTYGEFLVGLHAPCGKHLIGVVVMVIVATAATVLMMVLVMVVFSMMMTAAMVLLIVVVVLMMVVAAAATVLMMVLVMMVLMVVVSAAAVLMMVVMVVVLLFQLCKLRRHSRLAFHGLHQLLTGQLMPGSGDNGSFSVQFPEDLYCGIQLLLRYGVGTGKNDGRGILHLVVIKLTEVS